MSRDRTPLCILCCSSISSISKGPSAWMGEFRAVRRDERGPFLTGVGISRSPGDLLIAPRDENRRYDDYGFSDSDKDQFSSSPVSHANPGTGYVFHESCWRVLKACLYPSPVPVQTLYNICRSSPITCPGFVDLGLDYWGFIWGPKLQYSQRASRHVLRRVAPRIGRTSVMGSNAQFDPFDIPKLERILDKTQQPAPQEDTGPSISPSFRNQSDCFNRLPPELLEEIRVLLPSSDVANLHLISRTFASLSLSQYFWASRFRGTCERSHIFEPTILEFDIDGRKTRRDWKSLYHETGRVHSPPDTLYSRERVWNCIRPLAELLVEIPPVSDGAVREFQGVETETDGWKSAPGWRCIGGNFRPRSHRIPWSMACNIRFEQNVYVPEDLERIDVTILSFCDQQYVSGLRLISRKKSNIQLGYVISGKETILHVGDRDGGQNILTGFICALGDLGIQGLRTVASKGQLSEWAGAATDSSQTLRLCVGQPISELKAAFDGFKMVGLAVPDVSTRDAEPEPTGATLPLRPHAIWYPSIPPENVFLHDDTYTGEAVSSAEYLPVVHTIFGGPKGVFLKYLTQITAVCTHSAISGLEFSYDSKNSPIQHQQLHCSKETFGPDLNDLNRINFSINGPSGELITQMQVGYAYRLNQNVTGGPRQVVDVMSLVLGTNQGRKFTIEPGVIPVLGRLGKTIKIPPGRIITGFYGMDDPWHGMSDLGVISELLSTNDETKNEDRAPTAE